MNKQKGLSLVELMIAILISSFLLIGVLDLFSNTSSADRANTALSRMQESGRVLLDVISSDVLRAGYQGCSAASNTVKFNGLTFPNDAIAVATNSITLRYATPNVTATNFPNKTCSNGALYLYTVSYSNCPSAGVNRICRSVNGGTNESIVDNASISAIAFLVPAAGNQKWVASSSISSTDLANATSVRLGLQVTSPTEGLAPRSFSGTYQLRNRL